MARTALIVEDDAAVVEALRQALVGLDVSIEVASHASVAIDLIRTGRFCGLVLDLVLESGSGFDVLHYLDENHVRLPTVVVTKELPNYIREMLHDEQVKLVFPKPVDSKLLASVVLGLCGIPVG